MELTGLTTAQVDERLARGQQNISSATRTRRTREILFDNIFSVFNFVVVGIICFLLFFYLRTRDERLLLDSIGVLTVAFVNTILAVSQEVKAKRALDKVNLLLARVATVVRDGQEVSIDQSAIVIDDLVRIERGDQIVVDGRIVRSHHLEIDESLLTGESVPVLKGAGDETLSGSFCVSGNGYYVAERVGDACHAAEVTTLAKKFKHSVSPLQKKINHIVEVLLGVSVVLVLLEIFFDPQADFGKIDFIRRLSTIVISLLPQGLVLMASITFALGVYRISRIGAIIEKLNAIESFSNVEIVCMDKTGTLTQNKLSVNRVTMLGENYSLERVQALLGTYAKLSSDKNATLRTLEAFPANQTAKLIAEIPFSSEKKMSLLSTEIEGREVVLILGGFDLLLPALDPSSQTKARTLFADNRLSVYRNVLFGTVAAGVELEDLRSGQAMLKIEPICVVSITDLVRDDVMDAIRLFQSHNISFKILSGDAPDAVQAVAREIGWDIPDEQMVTGSELDAVPDENFADIVLERQIFARLRPDHKLRIIESLKQAKIHTAMIGDGVNDLPAIKASDMGIAMEEGSKITKEVADIVLLKNKFSLLPQIFDEGNKIVNTVNAVAKLFLTKNFLVIYLGLLTLIFLFEFPLTPRRVSLINIFAIVLPSFVIALRNNDVSKTKNFSKDLFSFVIISSLIIAAAGHLGEHVTPMYFEINAADLQMVMLSIMIVTSVANFLAVALHRAETNVRLYLWYGLGLLAVYVFLAANKIDFFPLNGLKKFYEIEYLAPKYWIVVGVIGLSSAGLLFVVQKLRERLIERLS
ncbi:MAG: cation-transporting P-type ATPase [Acidobacteriota bacterium]|nr:cation-transporting P-type ATPase [Acidobacteriota bacterium]